MFRREGEVDEVAILTDNEETTQKEDKRRK